MNADRDEGTGSGPVFTIGHSNLAIEAFLQRLARHEIEVLVDIRSAPYSRRFPQFCRPQLCLALREREIDYRYDGSALGGKPVDPGLCREDGGPDYDRMAAAPAYRDGLDRLIQLAEERRVVVMCAEAEPEACHRHKLVARSLCALGIDVLHILPDGSLRTPLQPWLPGTEVETL
jgi:uncharacterized protein (DUF488 family)